MTGATDGTGWDPRQETIEEERSRSCCEIYARVKSHRRPGSRMRLMECGGCRHRWWEFYSAELGGWDYWGRAEGPDLD